MNTLDMYGKVYYLVQDEASAFQSTKTGGGRTSMLPQFVAAFHAQDGFVFTSSAITADLHCQTLDELLATGEELVEARAGATAQSLAPVMVLVTGEVTPQQRTRMNALAASGRDARLLVVHEEAA